MKKPYVLLLIVLPIISGLFLAPGVVPAAHATSLVGKVCLASTTATDCPITPPTIAGPLPGLTSFFLLRVLVNSSDALNGWDITLRTDHTVLSPAGVKIGTVNIGTATEIVKCIGGVNKLGSSPCPPTDSVDTLHYAVSGSLTPSRPVTDLLFTANFTIVANSANTPITFQTGCTGTSVTGGVCVTITNGSTSPNTETSQTAKFSNQMYFDLVPSAGSLEVSKGDIDLSVTVVIPSLNAFIGIVNLGVSSFPVGPTVSMTPNSATVAPGSDGLSALNVTVAKTVAPGPYTLNITGTNGALPMNWVAIQLIVPTPDFTLTPTPNNLFFNVTVSGTSNMTISSVGNFNGTVTLALPPLPQGLTASLVNPTLKLSSKGTNMTKLVVNSTSAGTFDLNITATSGLLVHFTKVTITVLDYFLHVNPGVLNVLNGTTVTRVVEVNPTGFYNVTVTVGKPGMIYVDQVIQSGIIAPSNGVLVSCGPLNILKITSTGNTNGQNSTNCAVTGQAVGNYIVIVTATSGSDGRTSNHAVSFQVAVIKPSYTIILPSTTVTTVSVGSSTSFNLVISGNHGLRDNVTIDLSVSDPSISLDKNASIARLTSTSPNATILVTITTSSNTPSGTYTLTVTGTGTFSSPPVITATTPFVVITTTSPQDLEVYSVSPSATSVTVGQDVTITILVRNIGKLAENATVIAIVADQDVGAKNVTLSPGQNVTVTITWHTSGFGAGAYMIGGKVPGVSGESILSNNLLRSATPVTLNAANTSILSNPYTIPAIVIAAIILVAGGLALFFLPRRKTQSA